jgi:hypothetical protein
MRHAVPSSSIAMGPQGVGCTTADARLIAPASPPLHLPSSFSSASSCTVDLASVATPTDDHLDVAPRAEKEPPSAPTSKSAVKCLDRQLRPSCSRLPANVIGGLTEPCRDI